MKKDSFYLTTTLPYVNSDPHVGFALELVQSDILVKYKRLVLGKENVFFNTGTDEHGQKIYEAAKKAGESVETYVNRLSKEFENLNGMLGIENDAFIRTTSSYHKKAAEEIWKRCEAAGDIYKKAYEGNYCVGCEAFKTDKDLENGKCVVHPNLEITILKEENYFFKFSKYQNKLKEYLSQPGVILPEWRRVEALNFVNGGLEDFSISREKKKLSWGISVPGDENQVMYVWFDALTNYISTLGWPEDGEGKFQKFWNEGEVVQMAGKDQVRFQSIMWQAMLFSAGIKNTNKVIYHGFLTSKGQKMSKSLGNVINPKELVDIFGKEISRLLLAGVNQFEDTDVSMEGFKLTYKTNLVNGLGNLVARIMKLAEDNLIEKVDLDLSMYSEVSNLLDEWNVQHALFAIFFGFPGNKGKIQQLDEKIQIEKPWETKDKKVISEYVKELGKIAYNLEIFMPETSKTIMSAIRENKKPENLFPRKD